MDEQGPELHTKPRHGTIPRLSKLPMPRASNDSLRLHRGHTTVATHEDPVKTSILPRPNFNSTRIRSPAPLGENANQSIRSKYGWNDLASRVRSPSPVRDALKSTQAGTLETTPPSAHRDVPVFEDGNENVSQRVEAKDDQASRSPVHRKPRPSLSDRTIESLAQISPSQSPSKRRSSIVSSNGSSNGMMGPPPRPASNAASSRPITPLEARLDSPTKRPFRPPGRSSPTKNQPLPAVPSPGSLYTPPKAFLRGGSSRIAQPSQRSTSTTATVGTGRAQHGKPQYSSQTVRVKTSTQPLSRSNITSQSSLDSIFKDPESSSPDKERLSVDQGQSGSGLLRPRSRGENTIAKSPVTKTAKVFNKANTSKQISTAATNTSLTESSTPKSSATLRETIAKAKAARKLATTTTSQTSTADGLTVTGLMENGQNHGLLKKRIEAALSSGQLNIAAMQLDVIPQEILSMYDVNDTSVTWSEMVDMIKFNAADNKLDHIDERVFPDYSIEEMNEDDEKTNQFGGLELLDLHNNSLSILPVGIRQLHRLSTLNLSGNQLSNDSLDIIWQLPNLQDLNLNRNKLAGTLSVTLSQSSQLRVLQVQENQISTLVVDSRNNSCLQKLNISSNTLSQLPWEVLSVLPLVELDASSNQLTGIAFEGVRDGFEKLKILNFSRNTFDSFTGIPLSFPDLHTAILSSNRFTAIPDLGSCHALTLLQVSENKLVDFPDGIETLMNLKTLDISQNEVKVVKPEIAQMECLTALDLSGNPLRDRKYLSMTTSDLKDDLMKRLAPIDDRTNEGDPVDALANTNKEQSNGLHRPVNGVLDLSSKSLSIINVLDVDLTDSSPIHTLRLSNNELTVLPIELLTHASLKWSLKSIDISHNPLLSAEYLTSDLFLPSLQSLYIVSTGLTSLDALTTHLKAPELTELNISINRLAGHLPWIRAWFPHCTSLLATDNWFSSIDVEAVRGLEMLDIRNNEIEVLPARIGLLGNRNGENKSGMLRMFECGGNRFRVPRINVIEKGTEAVLKDLRRMVPEQDIPAEWREEI